MDIFTTQLTRVVQAPIKATSLKVKALLKASGSDTLKEDLDHLENHQYYFVDEKEHKQNKQKHENQEGNASKCKEGEEGSLHLVQQALNKDEENELEDKHQLDLYV